MPLALVATSLVTLTSVVLCLFRSLFFQDFLCLSRGGCVAFAPFGCSPSNTKEECFDACSGENIKCKIDPASY